MVKIAFITPDNSLVDLITRTYREHSEYHGNSGTDSHEYEFGVFYAANFAGVQAEALAADIIISRGLIASQLKESCPETSIVEVPIGSEMIAGVYQAIQKYGRQPIAVMGAFNFVYSTYGLDEVMGVDVKAYLQTGNDPEHIREVLGRIFADGRKIVLCGANTYPEALKHPCVPVLIGMSRESIWQAISEAKHGAVMRRREAERAEQFRTVLNHTGEGVIATDEKGHVTVFNAAASEILRIPAAVGMRLDRIAPSGHLGELIGSNVDCTDAVVPYQGEMLSVNKVSVFLHGDFSGHVVTLQKSSSIQKAEGNIRRQLYAKGHVARYTFADIVGDSPAIQSALKFARNFARVSSNIMIMGDTGTGKEMFAQGIHNASDRRAAPFVAINCAALSKSLLESELFGYAEGAFTGARKGGKAGIFEIAHTGTIFLDEISEVPLDLQGQLLRVLQERQIMRVGGDTIIPIDVRIISAANKPLLQEVANNNFRKDLYYRLNVLALNLPGLDERGADIVLLAEHFLTEYCNRFNKPKITLSDSARSLLLRHHWDGNTRELRNVCECLSALNDTGMATGEDIAPFLANPSQKPEKIAEPEDFDFSREIKRLDRERILSAISEHGGDRGKAARHLGISRTTLWRKLKKKK